jgi:methylglutaconyl-CoA hydratase
MTDHKPTEAELNALDVTDAEEAEINRIAHPLLADPAPDANDDLVQIDATTDGVVFVTINRPAKKNAFDAATIAALHEAFETLHGADHVRAVFVRGAGGTFSAGADLNWMRDAADWSEADNRDDAMGLAKMLKALHDVPALTCAIVEGAAAPSVTALCAATPPPRGEESPSPHPPPLGEVDRRRSRRDGGGPNGSNCHNDAGPAVTIPTACQFLAPTSPPGFPHPL